MTKINYLLDSIDNGQVVLPEFQRGYVWSRDQVKGLFQSLYERFPIGGLLMWSTSADSTSLRGDPVPGSSRTVKLLLDGQQRITSLYGVIRGKPPRFFEDAQKAKSFSGLYFNVQTESFEFFKPTTMTNDPRWISVSDLFLQGPEPVLEAVSAVAGANLLTYVNRVNNLHTIGERELHEENLSGDRMTVDVVVDIFNRVNSGGTKLSKGDLALARICAVREEARSEIRGALAEWAAAGYDFKSDWLLRTVNIIVTGEALFEALRGISSEDFGIGFKQAIQAIDFLLNLLSSRLGVDDDRILQGKYGLAVLARLVAEQGGKVTDLTTQNRMLFWYLHQSMWGRYSGSTESTLNQDLEALEEGGVNGLIELIKRSRGTLRVRPEDFDSHSMGSRFYPVLYILTRMNDSQDLCSGLKLSHHLLGRTTNLDVHHIFPSSLLYEHGYNRSQVNAIANFTFLTADCNKAISNTRPAAYFPTVLAEHPNALASHWIADNESLWDLGAYLEFLGNRRQRLADATNAILDNLLQGNAAGPELVRFSAASNETVDDPLTELSDWCDDLGLARPEIIDPVVDDETGEALVYPDAHWPEGMQQGKTQKVALILEPDAESEGRLGELGYRFFTSIGSLHHYVEDLLNIDLDDDGVIGPVDDDAPIASVTPIRSTDLPRTQVNVAVPHSLGGATVLKVDPALHGARSYADYDFPVPLNVNDLEAIRDGSGKWRRKNRDAFNGLLTRSGCWTEPDGSWKHAVRAKVFALVVRYMDPGADSPAQREVIKRIQAAVGHADQVRQSFELTGSSGQLGHLEALGEIALEARDHAWAAGDRQAAYYLALYGGRAFVHADEAKRELGWR